DIAHRYRVSVALLQSANPTLRPHALRVGQRIIVPMSGRVVPLSAWSVPPERTYRRISRGGAAGGGARLTSASGEEPLATHRVQLGENATTIARRYGVGLTALLNYNGLTMGSMLRAGDILKIPPK